MALTKELVVARRPHPSVVVRRTKEEGPREPAGFEGGFGPKGLGRCAQALAWVALFLRASPVRAPENARAIHIDRTQIQMTISSAPSGLIAFIVTPPRLKPGLSFQGPSGRNRLQSPTGSWAEFPRPFLLRPMDYGGQVGLPSRNQPYPINQITCRD
jgi:hypothetical protein